MSETSAIVSIWRESTFRAYLGATSSVRFAFSMQQLLIAWLLIGVLDTPAQRVGFAQAIIGVPGLILMLWGGASADRTDPRALLIRVYVCAIPIPLVLAAIDLTGLLSFWTVTVCALLMSVASSYSSPSDAAILNRAAGSRVQEAVTASTAAGFVMQVIGLTLAGQMARVGLDTVLAFQSAALLAGACLVARLPRYERPRSPPQAAWRSVREGLVVMGRHALIRSVLLLNFASMLFNAGTYTLVLPFMLTKVYQGDAAFLAWILVVFFSGGAATNFAMLRFMPLRHPGRLFLTMQLTRAALLLLLWLEPPLPVLVLTILLWGVNMGVTTTLSRAMIQETASEQYRGRILSVYNVGFLGAQPIGAMLLGGVVSSFGIHNGFWPGIVASALICCYGMLATPIWRYRSPEPGAA